MPTRTDACAGLDDVIRTLRAKGDDRLADRFQLITLKMWGAIDQHEEAILSCFRAMQRGEDPNYERQKLASEAQDAAMDEYERIEATVKLSSPSLWKRTNQTGRRGVMVKVRLLENEKDKLVETVVDLRRVPCVGEYVHARDHWYRVVLVVHVAVDGEHEADVVAEGVADLKEIVRAQLGLPAGPMQVIKLGGL